MPETFIPQTECSVQAEPEERVETRDVSPQTMLKIALWTILVLAALQFAALFAYTHLSVTHGPQRGGNVLPPNVTDVQPPGPPLLQRMSGKAYNEMQEQDLNSYGWVDRAHGMVHVPIHVAMQMLLKQAAQGGLK